MMTYQPAGNRVSPPDEPDLTNLLSQLRGKHERVMVAAHRLMALGDTLYGEGTNGSAGSPAPSSPQMGLMGVLTDAVLDLDYAVVFLEAQVDRLGNLG